MLLGSLSLPPWLDLIRVFPPSSSSSPASPSKGQVGPSTCDIIHCKWGAVGNIVRVQWIHLVCSPPLFLVGNPLVRSQNWIVVVTPTLGKGEGVL